MSYGCGGCRWLVHVHNHPKQANDRRLEPCSQKFACNPFWDGKDDVGRIVLLSFCSVCNEFAQDCQCAQGVRQVKAQVFHIGSSQHHPLERMKKGG